MFHHQNSQINPIPAALDRNKNTASSATSNKLIPKKQNSRAQHRHLPNIIDNIIQQNEFNSLLKR